MCGAVGVWESGGYEKARMLRGGHGGDSTPGDLERSRFGRESGGLLVRRRAGIIAARVGRVLKLRRNALAGLIAALLTLGAGAVLFWLPGLVGQRIAAKIEARTGIPAQVEGVSLRMSSVAIA